MKKLIIPTLAITAASVATLTLTAAWAGPNPLSHSNYTPLGHSCKVTWHAAKNAPMSDASESICPAVTGCV
jgi:hypothetical protein